MAKRGRSFSARSAHLGQQVGEKLHKPLAVQQRVGVGLHRSLALLWQDACQHAQELVEQA